MTEALDVLLITDVHNGPSFEAKAGPLALEELRSVIEQMESEGADLLVDLGDRINNTTAEMDDRYMAEVAALFAAFTKERHHLLGNHDVKFLTAQDNERILGQPMGHRLLHRGHWNLLLWSPAPRFERHGCIVPNADIEWLSQALDSLDSPTAIFTHVPLGGGSMLGNYYFEGDPVAGASYRELAALQHMVLGNNYIKLAVAGHVHWNSVNVIDGVPFLTVQSLSELATTSPFPAGAWARLRLEADAAHIDVEGLDRFRMTLPLRRTGKHWLRRPGMPPWRAPSPMASPAQARGIILDLDGVIYRGNQLLPGAQEFINALTTLGKRVVAVSNHSGATAQELASKLQSLGVPLQESEVITSIDATVAYLHDHYPAGASALVVGSPALETAIAAAGFPPSASPDLVVLGYQNLPKLDKMMDAAAAIAAGAPLIGTNADAWLPSADGTRRPETGPYLAMVAALAGKTPAAIVGKPNQVIGNLALKRLGLDPAEVMVVGDTLSTDIGLAKSIGSGSALLLTGNTSASDPLFPRPDFVYSDLKELSAVLLGVDAESSPQL